MKIVPSLPAHSNVIITFADLKSYKSNIAFYLGSDITNCKLSYIHGAGALAYLSDEEDKKGVMNELLKMSKGCVIINTTNLAVKNFLSNNYTVYYTKTLPIGYGTGFHYHICIRNDVMKNANCKDPVPEAKPLSKEHIKEKLKSILKSKKRKSDYVDEFINSL